MVYPTREQIMGEVINPNHPTKKQIAVFLNTFKTLNTFESDHRLRCGWGAFQEDQLPIEDANVVYGWLESLTK
jgi:hypothetical protein